jgi:hypothetical protein
MSTARRPVVEVREHDPAGHAALGLDTSTARARCCGCPISGRSWKTCVTKILSVCVVAALLAGCGALQYSDSETTDVEEIQDDQKGEHPDEPIIE